MSKMTKEQKKQQKKQQEENKYTNSWLNGLVFYGRKGWLKRFRMRQRILKVSEWSFVHKVTYGGSVEDLSRSFARYSKIEYRPSQISDTIKMMMRAGINIQNIENVYNESTLQEFKTVMISQDGTHSELILKRSKDNITKKVIGTGKDQISVIFDCPLDAYIYYGQKGHPTRLFRICRARADEEICWIYTEVFPVPNTRVSEQFDYYQKTGMQFYRLFLVMQFLWMHKYEQEWRFKKELFETIKVRDGSEYKTDSENRHRRAKRVKIPVYDYRLGDLSKMLTRMQFDKFDWHQTFRAFAVSGWADDGDYKIEDSSRKGGAEETLPTLVVT